MRNRILGVLDSGLDGHKWENHVDDSQEGKWLPRCQTPYWSSNSFHRHSPAKCMWSWPDREEPEG